jgi:alkylation response protein AidB-like acyl-CoA dehydrogenase
VSASIGGEPSPSHPRKVNADTAELFFEDCRVPAVNLLGGVDGQGFY